MNEETKSILSSTAIKTFEELAFLFAFTGDEADTGQTQPAVTARISFSGVVSGTLVMKISAVVLPELAANMLGIDEPEETTLDQQNDAFKETLNVFCGNLLPQIYGTQEIFDLDPPEIVAEGETLKKNKKQDLLSRVVLAMDQGSGTISLYVEDRIH
jgi:chemotaxis protein CheX